jgi:predicted transcriptional regulator
MENDHNPINRDKNTNSNAAKQILQTMIKEKFIVEADGEIHVITTSAGDFIFKVDFANDTIEEVHNLSD